MFVKHWRFKKTESKAISFSFSLLKIPSRHTENGFSTSDSVGIKMMVIGLRPAEAELRQKIFA